MADDLDKKLKQIADMFGVSDTSGLRNIVDSISPPDAGANQGGSSPNPGTFNDSSNAFTPAPATNNRSNGVDLNFLAKAGEMLSMINNVRDSRITLLNSVQPFLGTQRQQRLNGAVQLLKVISIISAIAPNNNGNTKG